MLLSRGDRDLGVAFQTHPGRQAFISSGSKEARSALESRRVSLGAHWVDSRESSLLRRLREVARLVARPCRRRRPSSLDDGGISGLFSSGGPSVRFLTRYDGEVSEPLAGPYKREPCRGFVARHAGFGYGGKLVDLRNPPLFRRGQDREPSCSRVRFHQERRDHHHLDLAGKKSGDRGALALEGHMHHVDCELLLEVL